MPETLFTRDQLKEVPKRFRWEKISSEEWHPGTKLMVWELSIKEQTIVESLAAKYIKSKTNRKGESTVVSSNSALLNAHIAILCCRDENNVPVFKEDDVDYLLNCPQIVMSRILDAYKKLNQVSDEDIEELVKNSETTPTYISALTLPSDSDEQ